MDRIRLASRRKLRNPGVLLHHSQLITRMLGYIAAYHIVRNKNRGPLLTNETAERQFVSRCDAAMITVLQSPVNSNNVYVGIVPV